MASADVFNVRDFGAVGDGVTDDTAAFQAAIDACTAASALENGSQRRVEVPGGDYLVGPLTVPRGLVMWGDGSTTSVLYSRDQGQATLTVAAVTDNSGTINIRDLGFWSEGKDGTAISLAGSAMDRRVHDVRIEDCVFAGFDTGLSMRLAANVWLTRLHAADCTTGFRIDTSGDVKATNCFATQGDGWGFWISDDGLHGASGEGVYLTTCSTNVQAGGLKVENQHWGAAIGCSFTSCEGPAVTLDGHGWRISAPEIATAKFVAPGIVLSATSEKVVVTGGYFALNSQGIVAGGKDHLIASNIFESGATQGRDIVLEGRNILVTGNIARSQADVSIEETAGAVGNVIDQNTVWGAIVRGGTGSVITATNYRVDPATGTVVPVQEAPQVSASDHVSQAAGQSIPAADLFVASDANDDVLRYSVRDDTADAASGTWMLAGVAQPAGLVITVGAAQLGDLAFMTGSVADALAVRVSDAVTAPSDWAAFQVLPGDGTPALRITPSLDIDEVSARAVLEVSLEPPTTGAAMGPVTVQWAVEDGTARVADRDMPPGQGGTLTFLPGGALTQQVLVQVNDQADLLEGDETFKVRLSGATGAAIAGATAVVRVHDDYVATGPVPLLMYNTTTGLTTQPPMATYTGPLTFISSEYFYLGDDSVVLTAKAPNVFLRSDAGNDALAVTAGQNVLDAGGGSNFLTGGVGADTFYLDARALTGAVWSTVSNLGTGDAVTLWGVGQGTALAWTDNLGASGFEGLTLQASAPGSFDAKLTLSGYTNADRAGGRLGVLFGHDDASGSDYMYIYTNPP